MSPSARNQPMITRPFRGQRLDRKLFHRPRHRRAAPPPQEIRFCGLCWALPRDRSRGRHVPVRGSGGGVKATACVCPPLVSQRRCQP